MATIHFDLKELGGHFDNVAKENNRITLGLNNLEKELKPVRDGLKELSLKHIRTIKEDLGFIAWWKMPVIKEKELEDFKGIFKNLAPFNKDVISMLYELLKNIELVSVLLRCIRPENYGILSPPVEDILNVPGKNQEEKYINYLQDLERLEGHYGFSKIAKVDMALWTLAEVINTPKLQHHYLYGQYYKAYKNTVNPVKKIMAKNSLQRISEEEPLYKSELFLDSDYEMAGLIACRELDLCIKDLCRKNKVQHKKRTVKGVTYYRFRGLLNELAVRGYIKKEEKEILSDWWESLRNPLMHEPISKERICEEDVKEMIAGIIKFKRVHNI